MQTVNIHEAKTHLSRLVEGVEKGEPFIIARAGKPVVKVTLVEQPAPRRLGFMQGQFEVPDDFDDMQVQTKGEFGGLGIEVTMEDGLIKVVTPIDDTPAQPLLYTLSCTNFSALTDSGESHVMSKFSLLPQPPPKPHSTFCSVHPA